MAARGRDAAARGGGGEQFESLFRSAQMSLVQLYVPGEVAHATVAELAGLGNVEFKDLLPDVQSFQRPFVDDIKRFDDMSRRVRFLEDCMNKQEVPIKPLDPSLPVIIGGSPAVPLGAHAGGPQVMDNLAAELKAAEDRISNMNGTHDTLEKRLIELEEARHVLRETAVFFEQANPSQAPGLQRSGSIDDARAPLLDDLESGLQHIPENESSFANLDLEFVAGAIDRTRMATFERIAWRVLRGNLYMNYAEISESFHEPGREEPVYKNVFIIFAHGAELLAKIRKISESMGGTLYPVDANADRRQEALREVTSRIEDLKSVLYSTSATRRAELAQLAENVSGWGELVRKERIIYATLNLFQRDASGKTFVAEGWTPTFDIPSVQLALRRATENSGTSAAPVLQEIPTHEEPPTYMRVNKFTEGFQSLITAYGVATYQEVNPGLFTVISFPFLFAVMFGDVGHGLLMFSAALVMVLYEDKLAHVKDEIFVMFFYGRYIVLLMGAFAIFTGFIYNDIFSKSMTLFTPGWKFPKADGMVEAEQTGVYPIGLDPTWHGTDNALIFTNSLKMKLSILLGVVHMVFSICLQIPNHLHFKKPKMILAEVVPQLGFMLALFGYLSWTIVYKWSINWWELDKDGNHIHHNPPGLLNMLIYMFLAPGSVSEDDQLFRGQAFVQVLLLLFAFACVPWMLIAKPYILYQEHTAAKQAGYQAIGASVPAANDDEDEDEDHTNGHTNGNGASGSSHNAEQEHDEGEAQGKPEFELGEVIIHQVIHVIEYCLGCISNTASYLRLWALSLAHAQLSEVLWNMTLKIALPMEGMAGIILTTVMFSVWFCLTIAILCLMEGLSAFLHALRLMWVEAGNKHYLAQGREARFCTLAIGA